MRVCVCVRVQGNTLLSDTADNWERVQGNMGSYVCTLLMPWQNGGLKEFGMCWRMFVGLNHMLVNKLLLCSDTHSKLQRVGK